MTTATKFMHLVIGEVDKKARVAGALKWSFLVIVVVDDWEQMPMLPILESVSYSYVFDMDVFNLLKFLHVFGRSYPIPLF
ncbi:Protein SMG8 [Gossypium australe]|uniref:Protein SMG8 n=1 Tax=Gossypium australe TaxID=47621 RepID=A0A5B6WWR0_9ROSI|nr:Protein SMG8 [Gossypium australe]